MAGLSVGGFVAQRIGDGSEVAARIVSTSRRGVADGIGNALCLPVLLLVDEL